MATSFSMKSFAVTLLIFTIVLSPVVVLPGNSARVGRDLLQWQNPPDIICPACVCCAPPPNPWTCCPCFCPGGGGPVQAEVENNSP